MEARGDGGKGQWRREQRMQGADFSFELGDRDSERGLELEKKNRHVK